MFEVRLPKFSQRTSIGFEFYRIIPVSNIFQVLVINIGNGQWWKKGDGALAW